MRLDQEEVGLDQLGFFKFRCSYASGTFSLFFQNINREAGNARKSCGSACWLFFHGTMWISLRAFTLILSARVPPVHATLCIIAGRCDPASAEYRCVAAEGHILCNHCNAFSSQKQSSRFGHHSHCNTFKGCVPTSASICLGRPSHLERLFQVPGHSG